MNVSTHNMTVYKWMVNTGTDLDQHWCIVFCIGFPQWWKKIRYLVDVKKQPTGIKNICSKSFWTTYFGIRRQSKVSTYFVLYSINGKYSLRYRDPNQETIITERVNIFCIVFWDIEILDTSQVSCHSIFFWKPNCVCHHSRRGV